MADLLFDGPASYLDDALALATTRGNGMANMLEEVKEEYAKEVQAELERIQQSREKSAKCDHSPKVEAADCDELEDAYNLLFEEGHKPYPIEELKQVPSGTKPKMTFDDLSRLCDEIDEKRMNKHFMRNQNQIVAKENIPPEVTRSRKEAASILKQLAQEGDLYAIQKYSGGMRSAKITYCKDKLLLHRLRKKHPPSGVRVVYHNDIMKLVDTSSRLTFLQIGEPEFINFGKVFIRLYGNTLAAKQFSYLCTGEMGPTYAGSTCIDVFNENHKTLEYVRLGDYENYNGSGGKTLVSGLEDSTEDYKRPWKAGTVEGCWIWRKEIGAQFDILMKDNPGRMCEAAFGFVEEGFRVLEGARSEASCFELLCVYDCGLVLPY